MTERPEFLGHLTGEVAFETVNKRIEFWHNEIARQESAFIGVLLPASLTAASLTIQQIQATIPSPIAAGAMVFFLMYLGMLFSALCKAETAERRAVDLPKSVAPYHAQSATLQTLMGPSDLEALELAFAKVQSVKYGSASGKPIIALLIAVAAALITYCLK